MTDRRAELMARFRSYANHSISMSLSSDEVKFIIAMLDRPAPTPTPNPAGQPDGTFTVADLMAAQGMCPDKATVEAAQKQLAEGVCRTLNPASTPDAAALTAEREARLRELTQYEYPSLWSEIDRLRAELAACRAAAKLGADFIWRMCGPNLSSYKGATEAHDSLAALTAHPPEAAT